MKTLPFERSLQGRLFSQGSNTLAEDFKSSLNCKHSILWAFAVSAITRLNDAFSHSLKGRLVCQKCFHVQFFFFLKKRNKKKIYLTTNKAISLFQETGTSANAGPHYQKLYARVTHIWGNRGGQSDRSAMKGPRPGRTALLITVPPASGKYGFFRAVRLDVFTYCAVSLVG